MYQDSSMHALSTLTQLCKCYCYFTEKHKTASYGILFLFSLYFFRNTHTETDITLFLTPMPRTEIGCSALCLFTRKRAVTIITP